MNFPGGGGGGGGASSSASSVSVSSSVSSSPCSEADEEEEAAGDAIGPFNRTFGYFLLRIFVQDDHSGRRKPPVDLVLTVPAACGPLL